MPIYEYVCLECKREFELLRPMAQADQPAACEFCGRKHIKRKLTVCNAQSGGRAVAGSSSGCAGCNGGNCSSCGH